MALEAVEVQGKDRTVGPTGWSKACVEAVVDFSFHYQLGQRPSTPSARRW
jgi:hypothetical protein